MASMRSTRTNSVALTRVVAPVAALLVCKVAVSVVLAYGDYFPPNFAADFLHGREKYFWGAYSWAFYAHIATGPIALLLGTLLISQRFRRAAPAWHRRLGRVQTLGILLFVAPSGLWMAGYAMTGAVAAVGLASLAIATAVCAALGWKAAVARRFADHRRWMWRTYLLLCSAVVIRMVGGLATVCQFDAPWLYPLSTWASWLAPLVIFESVVRLTGNRVVLAGN
jgi:hypothetical protein